MSITKRISKFLLIAALAFPAWNAASAQDVAKDWHPRNEAPKHQVVNDANQSAPVLKLRSKNSGVSTVQPSADADTRVIDSNNNYGPTATKPHHSRKSGNVGSGSVLKAPSRAGTVVTVPSSATIEEWEITTDWNKYTSSNGWTTPTFSSTVQVAIDGNDYYIAGLCDVLPNAWVKGTLSGSTVTFASGQYYGTSNSSEYWFVGENSSDEMVDVVFSYNASTHQLVLQTASINNKSTAAGGGSNYYSYHENTVITRPNAVTIANGTALNSVVPVYGWYHDMSNNTSQMIYPASYLTGIPNGALIKSITFYTDANGIKFSGGVLTATIGTTSSTSFPSSTSSPLTISGKTATVVPASGATNLTFTFEDAFQYTSGTNLIIQTVNTTKGSCDPSSTDVTKWYGVSGSTYYGYNNKSGGGLQQFMPKMYVVYEVPSVPYAATLEGDGAMGNVQLGETASTTFTVTNEGANAFTPVLISTNAAFGVTSAETGSLAAGASRDYTVTFVPSAAQEYTGNLVLSAQESEASAISATEALSGTGINDENVTVAEGTATGKLPVYLYYLDGTNHGQVIYTADMLGLSPGSKIKAITFYSNNDLNPSSSSGTEVNTITLKLGETNQTEYSSTTFLSDGLTVVATKTSTELLNGTTSSTFTFSTPYEYQGGNLVVDASCSGTTNDGYFTTSGVQWLGQTTTNTPGLLYMYYSSTSSGNVNSTQNFLPTMTMVVEKAAGTATTELDFGAVAVDGNKTLSAYIANDGDSQVTANVTVSPNPPFSVASTTVTLEPNGTTPVPVTFSPKAAISYNGTLTVIAGNDTTIVKLKGAGNVSGPEAVRDSTFFAGITYEWPINNPTNESVLTEIATDPDQIIAMLREVYMNKDIPGNYVRGYNDNVTSGHYVGPNTDVQYTAAGTIKRDGQYVSFDDTYGWDIPSYKDLTIGESNSVTYVYMDPTEYKPNYEGVTLLLLEMVDDFDPTKVSVTSTGYQGLREYFSKTIKSARVITQAMRVGEGLNRGTLFNIDCDKMNKFYLIAKGQLQWLRNAYMAHQSSTFATSFAYTEPCYIYSSDYDEYVDESIEKYFFLGHMFEQFSPSMPNATATTADLYKDLVDMKSFNVNHDCPNVPYVQNGHHFMMYGTASISDDCQDVRDLMFFVPDQRMRWWYDSSKADGRGTESNSYNMSIQDYFEYNQTYAPKMGLFVIKQNDITGEQVSVEGVPTYKLHLTWASNLLEFMPKGEGMYTLYRVITDADGNKTYEVVCEFDDPNTLDYYDYVPMLQNGQQVTYVVQGQDKGKFLDLQMSNEESYIIPGLDHAEQLRINLNSDYYFSRYDAAEQKNYYSNSLIANNTVGTNVKPNYIKNGSEFKFWRATLKQEEVNGVTTTVVDTENAVNFVTATVENYTETGGGRLRYSNWSDDQVNFSSKPYGHGYHSTPATSNITISSGEVVFDGLKLYDNFCVGVAENTHPAQYVYYVTLETAVPFGLDQNLPSCATWQDGTFAYFECNYGSTMRAWAWNDSGNLTGTQWPGTGTMTQVGTHNGNKVWLWTADSSVQPTGILFNWDNASSLEQTGNFTFTNGGYYRHGTDNVIAIVTEENTSNQARSNTVSVPVYKTEMLMNSISAQDVEDDVTHQFPAATKFDVNTRYSSKDDILGYYIYRWADGETSANARSIYDEDGEDESPQGQAGNQAEYYTVAMNTDYTAETERFVMDANGHYPDVTATFVDNFMVNDAEEADTYTYAPVVELFAPHGAKVLNTTTLNPTNVDRADYNTYGGPQQMTAGGVVRVQVVKNAMSEYSWTADSKTYRYYNVYLLVDTLDLPGDYQVAKVRAWRKIDSQYLGEEEDKGYTGRLNLDANGEFVFVNKAECSKNELLGNEIIANNVKKATFGAIDVSSGETVPMKFLVRIYFTKNSSSKADGDKYYIMETEVEEELDNKIPVGINGVEVNRNVVSVKYYNLAGVESDQPFDGVNMVVTRYSDGSVTTSKVMK